MPPQIPPLDEQEFNAPEILAGLPGGTLNTDSIMWYFMNSPFFDPVSNNTSLFNQLRSDPSAQPILNDRRLFEDRLRSSYPTGLQFVVVAEPQTPMEPWVIQRQYRTAEGETVVQGTYYSAGTSIRMAPSLLDVVRSRMLSVSTYLGEVFDKSRSLTHFAPATNHSYLPAIYDAKAASTSRITSRIGSPNLAPTDPDASQSQAQSQTQEQNENDPTTTFSDALFLTSLTLTNTYYNEFMDENPLQGEPGAFVYTNTYDAILSRHQAQDRLLEKQQQQQKLQKEKTTLSLNTSIVNINSPSTSAAPTPKTAGAVGTPGGLGLEAHSRKGSVAGLSKAGKERRKKSKGVIGGGTASPVTPGPGP